MYHKEEVICERHNVPNLPSSNKMYNTEEMVKHKAQGMNSTVYSHRDGETVYIIKHVDKGATSKSELISSVSTQMVVQKEMNMAPEVIDFFMCDSNHCVIVMKMVGIISYKDHMKSLIKKLNPVDRDIQEIKQDLVSGQDVSICANLLRFYSAMKLSNYVMNYQLGVIHGDLHRGNIQLDLDENSMISRIFYIDFEYSSLIYDEHNIYDVIKTLKGIQLLNFINNYNLLVNKNNLHMCKMILDYCNQIITTLSIFIAPFGTPMAFPRSIKITTSDDIRSAIDNIIHHNYFNTPLCKLLVLLLCIYDEMYVSYVTAPFNMLRGFLPYEDPKNIRSTIRSEMHRVWDRMCNIYNCKYVIDDKYEQLLPRETF